MRILLAPDSFKGSLSAPAVAEALAEGLRRVLPAAAIDSFPLADGGEGFAEALMAARGGHWQEVCVTGPLPAERPKLGARLGWLDRETVVLEMASASGLPLVSPERREPLQTTSYGTGELIAAALDAGARHLILGLGGSATNDLGAGMAQALGMGFRRSDGSLIEEPLTGGLLAAVAAVDLSGLHPGLARCQMQLACDVDNPLLGPCGATAVYGPQKGATEAGLIQLEAELARVVALLEAATGRRVRDRPGAGAAGGMGAMLLALTEAELQPGIEIALAASGFVAALAAADLVITGEGRIDAQTVHGKTISGVARAAAAAGVPVLAIVGGIGPGVEALYGLGLGGVVSLVPGPMSLEEAIEGSAGLLADAAERLLRLVLALWSSAPPPRAPVRPAVGQRE